MVYTQCTYCGVPWVHCSWRDMFQNVITIMWTFAVELCKSLFQYSNSSSRISLDGFALICLYTTDSVNYTIAMIPTLTCIILTVYKICIPDYYLIIFNNRVYWPWSDLLDIFHSIHSFYITFFSINFYRFKALLSVENAHIIYFSTVCCT